MHCVTVEEALSGRDEDHLQDFRERNTPIDAVAECPRWLCFHDENEELGPWDGEEDTDREELPDDAYALPRRAQGGPQRSVPLRQRQETQEMLRQKLTCGLGMLATKMSHLTVLG